MIYDVLTKNESFIKMYKTLKDKGIKQNKFLSSNIFRTQKKELPITTTLFSFIILNFLFVMLNLIQHLCYLEKSTLFNCFFALSYAKNVKRKTIARRYKLWNEERRTIMFLLLITTITLTIILAIIVRMATMLNPLNARL